MTSPEIFNRETRFATRANSMLNPLNPKVGVLQIGDKGLAFYAENGKGFIQIPWDTITLVRVQMFFNGRYVRGFNIETTDGHNLEFIVHQAKEALKEMRKELPRDHFIRSKENLKGLFRRKR